jgi:hypothetical protein
MNYFHPSLTDRGASPALMCVTSAMSQARNAATLLICALPSAQAK